MKSMRIFFDTIILLDFLLGREPYCDSAETLFEMCKNKQIEGLEDGLQYECAVSEYLEAIITRNKDDFSSSIIPVYTADEFIKTFL